ncbi:RNA methyltransferase [Simiduia sp. 21SJ11W-1]|uniref:TrmH family RNA methyltransferase n=1 Tax=Simiduia sp. 21SJ11W-1 TaxID=2909669 RepID=UPI00209EB948|nr:RNA methyltransferase [Simiduia sp. 21SJ11W-1]UTA47200.1 RNA methyltransferase [Simiduia sp. 21SJ11W-1]
MKFEDAKKLHQKKYRQQFQHYLVEGEHLVLELARALDAGAQTLAGAQVQLFVTERYAHFATPFATTVISERHMAQLADTKSPQGIVAVVPLPAAAPKAAGKSKAIYLWQVQDPGNLGTILRTLAWFGGFRCLLSPGSVDPYNPKVVRASMGAIFHVPITQEVPLAALAQQFDAIGCLDIEGAPLTGEAFGAQQCYVFGNEAQGVPRDALAAMQARPFSIAGCGAIESLNLASAVNMSVYELCR